MIQSTESKSARTYFLLVVLLWLVPLSLLGWWRDLRALIGAFDTGIYLQVMHNLIHSGDLASSIVGERNFLAHHFQPVIVLFSPLMAVAERPYALLFLSLLATVATLALLLPAALRISGSARVLAVAAVAALFLQPCVAGRLWYGFSPDSLALPAFAWMALAVFTPQRFPVWSLLLAVLWAGTCKESFWLTNAVACAVFFARRGDRAWAAVTSAGCFAVFAFIFSYWMPAHTQLPSYYGMSYYIDIPDGGAPGLGAIAAGLCGNLLSWPALVVLATLLGSTMLLPWTGFQLCLLPALPGLMLILCAKSAIVRHPANHYLLSVLPFLTVAALGNAEALAGWLQRNAELARIWAFGLVAVPAAATLMMHGGVLDNLALIVDHPETAAVRDDVANLRGSLAQQLGSELPLVVDGSLQPLFADHRDTTILLGFAGNPRRMSEAELAQRFLMVTRTDLKQIPDCRQARIGDGVTMQADYAHFERLCGRVQSDGQVLQTFAASGLMAVMLPAQTKTGALP